jgi:hypothetical protein
LIAKNNRSHAFPANTLDILSHARTKQLKRSIRFRPILSLLKKTIKFTFFMKR